jgi:hypothetical protein
MSSCVLGARFAAKLPTRSPASSLTFMDQPDFKSPIVRQAYQYWLGKLIGDRLPGRSDLKPEEISSLLPYLYLVNVAGDPRVFRYRLVGTEIRRWAGREYTGIEVNERDYGPHWKRIHDAYESIVRTRRPSYAAGPAPWASREFQTYERIVMPLAADGRTVNMLFGALEII